MIIGLIVLLLIVALAVYCVFRVAFANKDKVNIYLWIVNLLLLVGLFRKVIDLRWVDSVEEFVLYLINNFLAIFTLIIITFTVKDICYYLMGVNLRPKRKFVAELFYALLGLILIFGLYSVFVTANTYVPQIDSRELIVR